MEAYKRLIAFRADLDRRAAELRVQEAEIRTDLAELEEGLDEAIILDVHRPIQEKIKETNQLLSNIQREIKALENPPQGGILGDLIKAVWKEAADEIQGPLREEWNSEMLVLEQARQIFLGTVSRLGEIKRKADVVRGRISEVLLSMPGPKLVVPSLATGVYEHSQKGPIYIDPEESEKAFKEGDHELERRQNPRVG
jgi:hypothetical protein